MTYHKRKLLKSIAATGLVGSSGWIKPVVQTTILPAHAQTSIALSCESATFSITSPTIFIVIPQVVQVDATIVNNSSQSIDPNSPSGFSFSSSGTPGGWFPGSWITFVRDTMGIVPPGESRTVSHTGTVSNPLNCNGGVVQWTVNGVSFNNQSCGNEALQISCGLF